MNKSFFFEEWPRLICITSDFSTMSHFEQVVEFCEAGAKFIQFRSKVLSELALHEEATKCVQVCNSHSACIIINDFTQTALSSGAHGVHLGSSDLTPKNARKILGKKRLIGSTVHSIEESYEIDPDYCDYVGLGPFRLSKTKPSLRPSLSKSQILKIVSILSPLPVFLIGGLNINDFGLIKELGVTGICCCSSLFDEKGLAASNVSSYVDRSRYTDNLLVRN